MGYYLLSPQSRELPIAARKFRAWMRSVTDAADVGMPK